MPKNDIWSNQLLKLIFQNIAAANIGNAGGLLPSSAAGNLYVSLHTADPADTGDQTSSEATYTGYARVAIVRSAAGWTVSDVEPPQVSNAALVAFAACTAGNNVLTFFGIGVNANGAGALLYSGALTASLTVSNGITPQIAIGGLVITEA